MKRFLVVVLLIVVVGCSRGSVATSEKVSEPSPTPPQGTPNPTVKGDQGGITDAEVKAAHEIQKPGWSVVVDEKHPGKPVIGLFVPYLKIDEKLAAVLNDLKHLKALGGYDVKFTSGALKLLKDHPTLEEINLDGSIAPGIIKELLDGPPIKTLGFGSGRFTTDDFETIAKIQSLQSLSVRLDGVKPEVIRPLHKLKNLESLSVSGFDPLAVADVAGFTKLKQLTCVAPNNSEPFFETLSQKKTLRLLVLLAHYEMGKQPPVPIGLAKIGVLTELTELTLAFPIGDANLKALGSLKNLQSLSIRANGMTGEGIKSLQGFPKLTSLNLSLEQSGMPADNPSGAPVLVDLAERKGFPGLKKLRLDVGPISATGAAAIGSLTGLESLALFGVKPGADKVMPHVAKLTKLHELDLSMSDLSDVGLKELGGLKDLETLKIGGTNTTAAGQEAIQKTIPKLKIDRSFRPPGV